MKTYHKNNRAETHTKRMIITGAMLIVFLFIVLTIVVGYTTKQKNLSVTSKAASSLCTLSYVLAPTPTPPPSSPTPAKPPVTSTLPPSSPTPPNSGVGCSVKFMLPDTSVCWYEPKTNIPLKYQVISLPPGGPYYMQTDWYITSPVEGQHHYKDTQLINAGQTYTMYVDWPGVPVGETRTVEIHAGLNVVNANKQILNPPCAAGMDYYWTPYVCPAPTPGGTSAY